MHQFKYPSMCVIKTSWMVLDHKLVLKCSINIADCEQKIMRKHQFLPLFTIIMIYIANYDDDHLANNSVLFFFIANALAFFSVPS